MEKIAILTFLPCDRGDPRVAGNRSAIALPLTFRFYQKKRGHRRTGSRTLGSVGEALFFGVFFVLGCTFLSAVLYKLVIPEWRVNHEFLPHTCRVLAKNIAESQTEEGTLYRAEIQVEYEVGGKPYLQWAYSVENLSNVYTAGKEDKQAILGRFEIDAKVHCWYDPANPQRVVLIRGWSWWIYLVTSVPVIFIFVGAGGILYTLLNWGKSAEHRAAMSRRVQDRELLRGGPRGENGFPNVPARDDITSSPGTKLRYRLPIATSPGWALVGTLVACLCWNGIVGTMVFFAVRSHLARKPEWMLTFFCIPFVAIGLFLIYCFFRQLLMTTGIGPTLLEISDHPLHPGGEYQVFLSQTGRLSVKSLALSLVCEEEATYRQGTDTRTESQKVFRQELFRREDFEIPPSAPFETQAALCIAEGAMHSFRSSHNRIQWTLLVEGDAEGWPHFERAFPIIIYPKTEGGAA
jgi:hypothetical protein